MNEEEKIQYRLAKLEAAKHKAAEATANLEAEAIKAGSAMRQLAELMQQGYDDVIYQHPDLMYLDVQLDGFYK